MLKVICLHFVEKFSQAGTKPLEKGVEKIRNLSFEKEVEQKAKESFTDKSVKKVQGALQKKSDKNNEKLTKEPPNHSTIPDHGNTKKSPVEKTF